MAKPTEMPTTSGALQFTDELQMEAIQTLQEGLSHLPVDEFFFIPTCKDTNAFDEDSLCNGLSLSFEELSAILLELEILKPTLHLGCNKLSLMVNMEAVAAAAYCLNVKPCERKKDGNDLCYLHGLAQQGGYTSMNHSYISFSQSARACVKACVKKHKKTLSRVGRRLVIAAKSTVMVDFDNYSSKATYPKEMVEESDDDTESSTSNRSSLDGEECLPDELTHVEEIILQHVNSESPSNSCATSLGFPTDPHSRQKIIDDLRAALL